MNKSSIIAFIIAILLMVPCVVFALPGPHDYLTGGRGYTCKSCHTANATLGASGFNNICTNCHDGRLDPAIPSGTIKPFKINDIANPFSSYTTKRTGSIYMTSHTWQGKDTIARANALPPLDSANASGKGMNKMGLTGSVTCARCHNVHGDSGPSSTVSPYLRSANSADEMCMDCHRGRDKSNHALGTHPVNVIYSSTSKANPTTYQTTPITNPTNPTANMKLKSGKLLCTTCHGVHFTDTNTATYDGYSNSVMRPLSTSGGMLLRASTKSSSSLAGTNICTNCHVGYNHQAYSGSTAVTKNIQCIDCHSGHVDYIRPDDPEKTPNTFMLRRYVNYSAGVKLTSVNGDNGFRRPMIYTTTDPANGIWVRGDSKGVCQTCHALGQSSTTTAHDLKADTPASDCNACHAGGSHANQPPAGCTGCHGDPPTSKKANVKDVIFGYVSTTSGLNYRKSSVFKNESTAGHFTHSTKVAGKYSYKYNCDQCHKDKDRVGDHKLKSNYQWVFKNNTGQVSKANGITLPKAANPTYYTTTGAPNARGACNNIYCHSNGLQRASYNKTTAYRFAVWSGSRNKFNTANRCVMCHDGVSATFNNLSTGSHFAHVSNQTATGKGYGCYACHNSSVTNNNTTIKFTLNGSGIYTHVDGTIQLSYSGVARNTVYNTINASCTSYCHTDGKGSAPLTTPVWTNRATGKCDTCHRTAVNTAFGILSSNSHFTHISSSYGPKLNTNALCGNCHDYTTELTAKHVNGTVDMLAANKCINCHGQSVPTWTSNSVTCESCHAGRGTGTTDTYANRSWAGYAGTGLRAPFKAYTTFNNRGHGKGGTYNTCQSCHDAKSKHINATVGDNRLLSILGTGGTNGECYYCHNDSSKVSNIAYRNMSSHLGTGSTYTGGGGRNLSTRSSCDMCHDPHGSKNVAMIRNYIDFGTAPVFGNLTAAVTFSAKTGRLNYVQFTPPYRGLCQICHTKTTTFRRNKPVIDSDHNGGSDCLGCHPHSGYSFAFQPSAGGCGGCHGYPPAEDMTGLGVVGNYKNAKIRDYAGGGGAHTVSGHIPKTAVETDAWGLCTPCHTSASHNKGPRTRPFINVSVPDTFRFNAGKAPSYSGDHSTVSGTCNNVSCHFKTSPIWGTP